MQKSRLIFGTVSLAILMICAGSPSAAVAQTNSLFGNRGPTTSSSNSFSSNFSLGGNSRGSAATSNITSGFSSSGMNFQNGGQGGPLGMSRDTNRVGFSNLGGNNNSNRGNSNSRNTGNRRNTTRNRNRQNFGNNFDNGNRGFNRNGQQGRNTRVRNVRPRQRVNFAFPERSTTFVVDALRTQFAAHAENRPALAGVSVQESNGRVVLTGYVDSEENRRLAAMIAKLEPGVTVVENRLTIQ